MGIITIIMLYVIFAIVAFIMVRKLIREIKENKRYYARMRELLDKNEELSESCIRELKELKTKIRQKISKNSNIKRYSRRYE